MREYTYQLVPNETGNKSVHVSINGQTSLVQSFDHATPGTEPFIDDAEAIEWAENWINDQKNNDAMNDSVSAQGESDAALDRAYKQAIIVQTLGSM